MKSGNLNFLEPSGPLQACNGTALPYIYIYIYTRVYIYIYIYIYIHEYIYTFKNLSNKRNTTITTVIRARLEAGSICWFYKLNCKKKTTTTHSRLKKLSVTLFITYILLLLRKYILLLLRKRYIIRIFIFKEILKSFKLPWYSLKCDVYFLEGRLFVLGYKKRVRHPHRLNICLHKQKRNLKKS